MSDMERALARRKEMVARWAALGHPETACVGHTGPLPGCPAPGVHEQVFSPDSLLTFGKVLDALKAVYQNLSETGRAGDEWAYEWVQEVWPALVPDVVRRAVGDEEADA